MATAILIPAKASTMATAEAKSAILVPAKAAAVVPTTAGKMGVAGADGAAVSSSLPNAPPTLSAAWLWAAQSPGPAL